MATHLEGYYTIVNHKLANAGQGNPEHVNLIKETSFAKTLEEAKTKAATSEYAEIYLDDKLVESHGKELTVPEDQVIAAEIAPKE